MLISNNTNSSDVVAVDLDGKDNSGIWEGVCCDSAFSNRDTGL